MDWIEEMVQKLLRYIRNLSFCRAMFAYLLVLAGIVWGLSYITKAFCAYENLTWFGSWCPFFYSFAGMTILIFVFYQKRLKKPLSILRESVARIQKNDLDFPISYEGQDELGCLCDSMEKMRLELVADKEEMWRLVKR